MSLFDVKGSRVSDDIQLSDVAYILCKKSKLKASHEALMYIFDDVKYSIPLLKSRKNDIVRLSETNLDLPIDKDGESDYMWLMRYRENTDEELMELLEMPYFDCIISKWLNKNWCILGINNVYGTIISPVVALVTPFLYMLTPIFVLRYRYGIKIGLIKYIQLIYQSFRLSGEVITLASGRTVSFASMALSSLAAIYVYVQGLFNCIRHAKNLYIACEKITSKIEGACTYVKQASDSMAAYGWDISYTRRWVHGDDFNSVKDTPGKSLPSNICGTVYKPWDARFGRALVSFKSLCVESMEGFAKHVSIFDAVRSISEHVRDNNVVPVEFSGPGFLARGLIHPIISNCVSNDISLAKGIKNIVLTGANASGKSTILRSIALASLMSQTVCVAYCHAIAIKPVRTINSHMCVPDDILKGKSRFQAEMENIGEIVAVAEKGNPCLIVIDELFSSTTASQCVVCLDGVLRRISDFEHCMFVLATHHDVEFDGVRRCTMDTSVDSFEHKYKMVKGINSIYNAEASFSKMINI
jgi:hypothetical protein